MGISFKGNGVGTSSISFTTVNLPNPITQTAGHMIIDQTQHLVSDSGVRSSYKPGQRQIRYNYRWNMLSPVNLELIQEFFETIDGGNNWFTLQDNWIPDSKKGNITQRDISSASIMSNGTDLADSLWPLKPIGHWVFGTSGANNNTRRRIKTYAAATITVDPAFSAVMTVDVDTFIIGTPVMISPGDWNISPRNNNLFDLAISFVEKGD